MRASSVFISRPVFTTVISIVIVLFGLAGYQFLGVREYPVAERPVITVTTSYPGADPFVIMNQITEPLEVEINAVPGVETMTSTSREGRSTILVEFGLNDDLDRAANDVRDRVAAAISRLPPDADAPVVEKADGDEDPIIFLNIRSDQRDLLELTDIARNLFAARMQTIPGVARADIWGRKDYSMRLWMDPNRLAAYGLTATDIREAINRANVELPSGRIEGDRTELSVRTLSRLGEDPEDFMDIVVKREGDQVVRFRDVGRAEIGPLNERTILRRDGIPMVGVVLRPQTGANQIEIVDEFYARLEVLKRDLPPDIDLGIGFDTSTFIRDSVREVQQTIFIAMALVCLTIFLFLREGRASLIPLITIPVALTGTFFILFLAGFSINVLTLLGLVLAIGLVVDDAIVVLENIYRRIESGEAPFRAGREGIREIFLAVVATTLSLIAVFVPIIFLGGLTGVLFSEFGVTLASAVGISSIVALTLTPMLCTRILKKHEGPRPFYDKTEPFFRSMAEAYRRTLSRFLERRWLVFPVFAACLFLIGWIWSLLPRELAPLEDRGLIVLTATGPEGATFEYMSEFMADLDRTINENVPEREAVISVTSPGFGAGSTVNSGFVRLVLVPRSERERSQAEIASSLNRYASAVPGARVGVRQQPTIRAGGRGLPVQFVVQNPDFSQIEQVVPDFLNEARRRPEFSFVNVDLQFNRPEVTVNIDRSRAEASGVAVRDIAATIQAALSGQRFGFFLKGGQQYEIIGQLERAERARPLDLRNLSVRAADGQLISLDNLVELEESTSPAILHRYNRFSSATFSANLADGYTLGEGIAAMREIAGEKLEDGAGFTTALAGESREFEQTGQSILFVFVFALILVYLVLAAQFESFRDPFVIMMTVPLALTGGLGALWYFNQTLNIFSQIGLVMLVGLVTKNGILLVEFANQRRRAGLGIREAVEDAAAKRFRPILMTAISTILGTLPIALAIGAGAQSRIPLGVAVIGGLLLGTFLTLFVIPAMYVYLSSRSITTLEEEEAAWETPSPENPRESTVEASP
jgi:multidrug efflux pump